MDVLVRKAIPFEEVDTATLRQALSGYASPDDKIGDMVRQGELIRLRRGFYAVAPAYRQKPLSLEIIANRLYGPSYLSMEYALSWHGMIPERVTELTSVCLGRSRSFNTEVGIFSFISVKQLTYAEGYDLFDLPDGRHFLMAVREKALVDIIANRRNVSLTSVGEVRTRLLDDLRMDTATLLDLDLERVERFSELYGSMKTGLLAKFLKNLVGEA
jgi:Predicted transcriptional regulator